MINLCLECGGAVSPEYADEHDGLCMSCAHSARTPMLLPGPHDAIDHDSAQPSADDPIADAIDRAWGEYYRDVGGDA